MQENYFRSNHKYFTISIYTIFVFAMCALIIKVIFNFGDIQMIWKQILKVTSPYLTGFFIAYLLNPLVLLIDRYLLEQKCHLRISYLRKLISILVTYLAAIGLVVLVFRFLVPELYTSVMDIFTNKLPVWYEQTIDFLENYINEHPYLPDNPNLTEQIPAKLTEYMNLESLSSLASSILPSVWSTSLSVIKWIVNLVIAIIVSIYLLADKNIIARGGTRLLYAVIPADKAKQFLSTLHECNKIFGGFIWGKTIDSLIIGILCLILLSIFRIPYAILISVVVGITNMIPYLGPYVGCVPGAFILLMSAPNKVIPYLLLILILQQFDGWILGPKILGDFTGLRPVLILFAISIGGAVAGIPGMFLGVPVVAVIQYLVSSWIDTRLAARTLSEEKIITQKERITLSDIFFKR